MLIHVVNLHVHVSACTEIKIRTDELHKNFISSAKKKKKNIYIRLRTNEWHDLTLIALVPL
jgi:hypothetical protein